MKEIAFQPGKFQPVVEIVQKDSGVPAPADTDFSGLEEVTAATLEVAVASTRGSGSYYPDPVSRLQLAAIIGNVLAARNIVEQLLHIGIHTRMSTPLRAARVSTLEPIVRAYNYFGHFELEGKLYVTRDMVADLIRRLFILRNFATEEAAIGEKTKPRLSETKFAHIQFDFYHLSSEGEIAYGKNKPLKDYILDLVAYIHDADFISVAEKIVWLRYVLDISTEASLQNFLRSAKSVEGFTPPDRGIESEPSAEHKAAMKDLFGEEYSSAGSSIPVSKFTGPITNAYSVLRRKSTELSYVMKTIDFPKYEGGSAAQLAAYIDDVLTSSVPLSLADSTAAVAFTTSFGASRLYKSAPGHERDELLRELITTSLISPRN
uniref:Coat protein n=1 Tax=Trichoderma harzianum partitivirus 2 TaxID=2972691 RepID=A0A976SHR7_9VIRU|nr:coat protein [Trichoderma harzianum partitivirus 2]